MGNKIAVVGVGNVLMGDEGAGVEAVRMLGELGCPDNVDLIDAGAAFFTVATGLRNYKKLIVIDAVRGGGKPGTLYRFTMDDVSCQDMLLSLHDLGVVDSLKLESMVGRIPDEIIFFGIEPQSIELSMGLSPAVRSNMERLVSKVLEEMVA